MTRSGWYSARWTLSPGASARLGLECSSTPIWNRYGACSPITRGSLISFRISYTGRVSFLNAVMETFLLMFFVFSGKSVVILPETVQFLFSFGIFGRSGRIPCPHPGRIWLEQRGLQRALYWHIEARVVLDLQEFPDSDAGRELHFVMVDGDFKKFEGKWSIKAGPRLSTSFLTYEVSVIPRFNIPAIFLERIIRSDLPVNLRALACRAESSADGSQTLALPVNGVDSNLLSSLPLLSLDSANPCACDSKASNKLKDTYKGPGFGTVAASANLEFNSKWGVYGKFCRLDRSCIADEVHLRRFDGLLENGGSHRCVLASITVKAPVQEVWNVLTSYEALPEGYNIAPTYSYAIKSQHEGCKGLLYMVLHARVVLDLHEEHEREIRFEQIEGDFDSFHGKWLFEQLGDHHTLLKYIVESKMHKDTFLSEAIVEEVVYEDLPSNLCAIRDFVENKVSGSSDLQNSSYKDITSADGNVYVTENVAEERIFTPSPSCPLKQRPKVPGLQKDMEVLKAEINIFISKHGQEGFMPMRKQLRLHGRVDIEKAITRMGGFKKVANLMNLSLAYKHRKPKGYWDNLENLQEEICRFQRSWGMDPTYMPSRKSLERAGRYDIARALEKWGGLQEVSRLLSLEIRHPKRKASRDLEKQQDHKAFVEPNDQGGTASRKPVISQDTQNWLTKLKDLDINWVE
ncbi:hypothetical protein AXF42_Ash016807 [Apostasia shenzhenica]|uniref:Coenzyme Q-binding protein COQ10 START domain-containing protein n=1 Tax=Apostasia shenzhenica TaxID=1088818 RepID=A0A2I0BAG4_9ASPA|nr:hypothetical protein AXF42_Ash016807 [Apostasia shenzhenica]